MPSAMGTEMEPSLRRILDYLSQRTGLCLANDRDVSLAEGVRRAMQQAQVENLDEFRTRIELDQAAFDDLVAEVTVGETYFHREPDQFEALRNTIIPDVQARKGLEHVVRFWSAACSSGEEAWSLAMVCQRAGLHDRCRILATDISRESLHKAEHGEYRQWSIRGPVTDFASSFLHKTAGGWRIADSLRRHVVFDYLNLALDNYPSLASGTWGCDVILCRNVLIYFDRKTVEAVVRRLYESLSPGGWLVLASTDPSPTEIAPFEMVQAPGCLLYQRPVTPQPAPVSEDIAVTDDAWVLDEPEPALVDSTILRSGDLKLQQAQEALRRGDLALVQDLTEDRNDNAVASALLVRALAGQDTDQAEQACAAAVDRHSTSEELQYLHAALLLELQRYPAAEQAVRKALFLDRGLAIGHFTLGIILQRAGNRGAASRAFVNCRRICERLPATTLIPMSDGEHAGRLAQMAAQHIALLEVST